MAIVLPKVSFPLLSSVLLLLAYGSFSWFLSHQAAGLLVWSAAIAFTLGQAFLLTTYSKGFKSAIDIWLRSDLGYFSCVILGALLVAFAFIWIRMFGYILVVVSAEILMRLDLQLIGFNRAQSWLILTLVSFLGLAAGWMASYYISPWF
ncbi:MAG: hypothetical protein WBA10_17290 [Elainellaceae cyanobacterium]